MKLFITALASAVLLIAGEPQAKKDAAVTDRRQQIPKEAVERQPGRFYYTDADGKKWIYVRTPFGASRVEDKGVAEPAAPKADPFANVKITKEGDMVTFERKAPFGVSKWQKKESDLTNEEKAALRRAQETAKQDR